MSKLVVVDHDFTKDQMNLIKATVAKGATDDELKLFLYRCKNMGLDPLKSGQIHFVKYGSGPGSIITGIEGFRTKAESTGKHTGTKRGVIRSADGKCIGAWCEVYRSDWQHCAREEVSLVEYNSGKAQWAKMPETMIKKVAEVAALRMAFPDVLGGMYSDDEMDQAAKPHVEPIKEATQIIPFDQAKENAEYAPSNYVVTFGKFKSQELGKIDMYELNSYVAYIKQKAEQDGKQIAGQVHEFMTAAENYLSSREFERS